MIYKNKGTTDNLNYLGMSRDKFIEDVEKFELNTMSLDNEFTKMDSTKYFGMRIYKSYVLVYLNVREKDVHIFDKSLESFKLPDNW